MAETFAGKRIVLTGSTGLIGSALAASLESQGATVVRVFRTARPGAASKPTLVWDFNSPPPSTILECDALIHLAGEPVVGLWTAAKKRRMRSSRIDSTRLLAEAIAAAPHPPAVFITASGVGFYGSRGDEVLTETSPLGSGFLAELARDWESASSAARATTPERVRVVNLRLAMVLAREGGALPRMLTPFRLGLGATFGPGTQYMSWIALADVVRAIEFILLTPRIAGAANLAAPGQVTNSQFTAALAAALHRRAIFKIPAIALRLFAGEMAQEMFLASQRAAPAKLLENGFAFAHPQLGPALHQMLR